MDIIIPIMCDACSLSARTISQEGSTIPGARSSNWFGSLTLTDDINFPRPTAATLSPLAVCPMCITTRLIIFYPIPETVPNSVVIQVARSRRDARDGCTIWLVVRINHSWQSAAHRFIQAVIYSSCVRRGRGKWTMTPDFDVKQLFS